MTNVREFLSKPLVQVLLTVVVIPQAIQAYNAWVSNKPALLVLSAMGILILVFFLFVVSRTPNWLSPKAPNICVGRALGVFRKGVVFTLGLHSHEKDSALLRSLEKQAPDFCAFLGTAETFAAKAVDRIADEGKLNADQLNEVRITPTDVENCRDAAIAMIKWMMEKGLNKREIVVDVTGGMVPVSLGAYMGARDMGVDVQYIASEYDKKNNKVTLLNQKAVLISVEPVEGNNFADKVQKTTVPVS